RPPGGRAAPPTEPPASFPSISFGEGAATSRRHAARIKATFAAIPQSQVRKFGLGVAVGSHSHAEAKVFRTISSASLEYPHMFRAREYTTSRWDRSSSGCGLNVAITA